MTIFASRLRRAGLAALNQRRGLLEDFNLFTRRINGQPTLRESYVNGVRLLVKANEDVGREIYFFGYFEPQESRFVLQEIRDSDICVDVGANVGFYTTCFAKKATRGAVHSFEPVPLNYHLMSVNSLSNGLSNVVINNCAVGDTNCEADFCVASDGAFSSLVDTGRKPIVETTKTRVVTLDSYCHDHNLPRIDILKIDVEGAEMSVLRGTVGLLSDMRRKPRLVMLELFGPMLQRFGCTIEDVTRLMHSYSYSPFIVAGKKLTPFTASHYDKIYNVLFMNCPI
jgi:FkbM family methyltransferase